MIIQTSRQATREELAKRVDELQEKLDKQDKEIETLEKIAEKLADVIQSIDNGICEGLNAINKCQYTDTKDQIKCIPCIIDWARKEVEK